MVRGPPPWGMAEELSDDALVQLYRGELGRSDRWRTRLDTTTNWALITDADLGLMWFWRRKPKSNTWVTEDKTMMNYGITARWSRGWVNPRSFFFSNA